jgi:hypothetical protein
MAAKNKTVRGTWVEALDLGGLGGPKRTNILLGRWGVTSMVRDEDPIKTNENIRDCIETLGVCLDS